MDSKLAHTAEIVAAYLRSNRLRPGDVPGMIATLHHALSGLGKPRAKAATRRTAAEIRRSITPEHLISFLDGKPYRELRRHLTANGLTPEAYRQQFGLPFNYPIVAEANTRVRSEAAKARGFGRKSKPAS